MAKSAAFAIAFPVLAALMIQEVVRGAPQGSTRVDPAVVPAGGGHGHGCDGTGCRRAGCRHHGAHHPDCRNGRCVPHCPVRPAEFGYYGTQWRRWPSAVVPVSSTEEATPAVPPRLEIPGPDEESPRVPALEAEAGQETGATTLPADLPLEGVPDDPVRAPATATPAAEDTPAPPPTRAAEPLPSETLPSETLPSESRPAESRPAEPPPAEPTPAEPPPAEPPVKEPPANLFDDAATRGWRKFLKPAVDSQPAETTLAPVAPVRFDQLEEARAAASARGRKISVATPK